MRGALAFFCLCAVVGAQQRASLETRADRDTYYGDVRVVYDRESGREAPVQDEVGYHGPMVSPNWLVAEMRRLNAFRKATLHCIGIGEADRNLLRTLAAESRGEVYLIGSKTGGR